MADKKALGKGLNALISGTQEAMGSAERIPSIRLENIITSRNQPRKNFDQKKMEELAQSIKENGVIQPIVVREEEGKYEIIIGERRLRAAKEAGLEAIPALIKDYSENKALELALIENIQREDLNAIEEALAYKMIIEKEMITQEKLSERVSKSRSYIANMIRLLDLPQSVQDYVSRGTISVGQAKAVVSLPDKNAQEAMVKKILDEQLTVRDVEKLTRKRNVPRGTKQREKDPYVEEIEERLRTKLGTKVVVDYRRGKGTIRIEFYSNDDLERILDECGIE